VISSFPKIHRRVNLESPIRQTHDDALSTKGYEPHDAHVAYDGTGLKALR